MEFWIKTESEAIQLPVPPSDFEKATGLNNTTTNIVGFGEINILGKKKLGTIPIKTFWPNQQYDFCDCTVTLKPYEFVEKIEELMESAKAFRLIITDTPINMLCGIENFNYGENDGTGDVYFTLELKEYRNITVKETTSNSTSKNTDLKTRDSKTTPSTYKVVKGDSLYLISKKVYGTGNKAKELQTKNGIKNPKSLKIGQVLKT